MQAYTIGLSINKDLKLEKGKGKRSSVARSYIWSAGHVTATIYNYPPQSTVFY
jgi:hypothetical protein